MYYLLTCLGLQKFAMQRMYMHDSFQLQLISLNRNPVNRNFRKWIGCEALGPIQDNDICQNSHHNEQLSCMTSQPTHFLKFRLTGFQLSEINCISQPVKG